MKILICLGKDWHDWPFIQNVMMRDKPTPTTIILQNAEPGDPNRVLWRYQPDMIWVFSDTMWGDKVQFIMDLAADREIPSTWYSHRGVTRYGW